MPVNQQQQSTSDEKFFPEWSVLELDVDRHNGS